MNQTPLHFADFKKLLSINFSITLALLFQELLISYELYKITNDPLTLGLIGLSIAIPYILLSLLGGYLADFKSKKTILILSLISLIICSILFYLLYSGIITVAKNSMINLTYLLFGLSGLARGFYQPTISAIRPYLIPRELYSRGSSMNSTSWQLGSLVGSIISGIFYVEFGLSTCLLISIVILIFVLILILFIKTRIPIHTTSHSEVKKIWESIVEGFKFVFKNKILFYSISLDLVAVLFAGVIAILPVFAEDILKSGATGLGYLRASSSAGTIIGLLVMSHYSPMRKAWRNMIIAVVGFGIATLIFAISENMTLSLLMLFLTGVFDSISIVIRGSLLQLIPPDHIRGRVLSVSNIFISSSNEIGAFESGLAARLMGTVPSVVAGASLTLVIIAFVYYKTRELLKVKFE